MACVDHFLKAFIIAKGKAFIIAKFLRTDLVIYSHSRDGNTLSYRRINTVTRNGVFWHKVKLLFHLLSNRTVISSLIEATVSSVPLSVVDDLAPKL